MSNQVDPTQPPRNGSFASAPGRYCPVIRIHSESIDPGDDLEGQVFFTGYGDIRVAKLYVTPSPGVFDENRSWWWPGTLKAVNGNDEFTLQFGGEPEKLGGEHGATFDLMTGGIYFPNGPTLFCDVSTSGAQHSVPQILTETTQENAPFAFRLGTHRDTRPGTYALRFILTYFDGEHWQIASQEALFRVRNILDRNQVRITGVGAVAACATFILGLAEVVGWFLGVAEVAGWPLVVGVALFVFGFASLYIARRRSRMLAGH